MKKHPSARLYWLTLLLSAVCTLWAQTPQYALQYINDTKGLRGKSVYKFYRDHRGTMWIGTDLGISSFNGHSIINYTMDCVPPLSNTNDIIEYPKGEILSACANGLYRADMNIASCTRICPDIQNATCFCLAGKTLLVGSERGVWIYKDDKSVEQLLIEKNAISKSNIVNDMAYDGKDGVWLTTNTHIVFLNLKSKKFTKYTISPDDSPIHLSDLVLLGDFLYIGTQNYGIIRFNRQTLTHEPWNVGIYCNVISDLTSNQKDLLYVSTDGNGAFVIDVTHREIKAHFNQFQLDTPYSNTIYTFWQDSLSGTFWWGFFEKGFCHTYHTEPICSTYKFKDVDTQDICVRSFAMHDRQKVIGTRNGIWFISESQGLTRYFPPTLTGTGIITDIQYFSGKYVIATYGSGLYLLDAQTQELSNALLPSSLHHGRFSKLVISPNGKQLVALSDLGLYFLDQNFHIAQNYTNKNSELSDAYLIEMIFDNEGKGWISSMKNLSLYDPTTRLIQSHGFPKGFFNEIGDMALCLCHNNDIIAASRDNVYRCKTDLSQVRTYDLYNRLRVERLSFITEGRDSVFWVGTNKGIFLFDKDFKKFRQLTEADNLPPLSSYKKGIYWDEQGTAWIGTERGLVYITPEQYAQITSKKYPPLTLDRLSHDTNPVSPKRANEINDNKTISLPFNPLLPWREDVLLSFSIAESGFTPAFQRCYEWSIDQDTFQICTGDETLYLKGLSFGNHTLRIRFAGAPETETKYEIRIYPATSCYAILLLILLLIILAFKITKSRKRQVRLKKALQKKHLLDLQILEEKIVRNMKLEEEAKEREKEENKVKSMYKKAKLSDDEYVALYRKVKSYISKEKPYVNADFKLTDLARAIGCPAGYLSQMFNVYTQQTFLDFINRYRIEEFKRLIKDPAYNHYTITAICELCGFKRSTFFSAFKKLENCTPSEYLQRHQIHR